jgi:hypothetical protein
VDFQLAKNCISMTLSSLIRTITQYYMKLCS